MCRFLGQHGVAFAASILQIRIFRHIDGIRNGDTSTIEKVPGKPVAVGDFIDSAKNFNLPSNVEIHDIVEVVIHGWWKTDSLSGQKGS